jgi:hypothetical protein
MEPRLLPGVAAGYIKQGLAFALYENGTVIPLGEGSPARQKALNGHLPIVLTQWKHGPFSIRQTAFAEPLRCAEFTEDNQRTLAWAGFDIENASENEVELTFLAFWTGNEKTPRPELLAKDGAIFLGDEAIASGRVEGDFKFEFLPVFPANESPQSGEPSIRFLNERKGVFNAYAIAGKLGPGKRARFVFNRVVDPGQNMNWSVQPESPAVAAKELTDRSFDRDLETVTRNWSRLAEKSSPFKTPDVVLNDIARKAKLDGLFLTKRWNGNFIAYDSVMYRCQWDSSITNWIYALDVSGDPNTASRLLDTIFSRQGIRRPTGMRTREGCFTDITNINRDGSYASWASCNGWALWAMAEHARLTGDKAWFESHKKQILDGCDWIVRERNFSREKPDNPCRGLLSGKFVCDLFAESETGEAGYFTYTDAISFVGLNSTAHLLKDWNHPEGNALLREAEDYRKDIIAAVDRLTDKSQEPWYVPWILSSPKSKERYFHDIVGPVNLAYSCGSGGVVAPDHPLVDHSTRWMLDKAHRGSIEDYVAGHLPLKLDKGAAFYSQDLALNLLERGRVEEFLRSFYTLLAAGVSHGTYTTTEWGYNTQPHLHSIASILRMFRAMMVQERDGELILLQGVPRDWFAQDRSITIDAAPTWYGPVSLKSVSDVENGSVRIHLSIPERMAATPLRLHLRLPKEYSLKEAEANGSSIPVERETIDLKGWKGEVEITARTARH